MTEVLFKICYRMCQSLGLVSYPNVLLEMLNMNYNFFYNKPHGCLYCNIFLFMGFNNEGTIIYGCLRASNYCVFYVVENTLAITDKLQSGWSIYPRKIGSLLYMLYRHICYSLTKIVQVIFCKAAKLKLYSYISDKISLNKRECSVSDMVRSYAANISLPFDIDCVYPNPTHHFPNQHVASCSNYKVLIILWGSINKDFF